MRKHIPPIDAPTAIPTVEPFPLGSGELWGDGVTVAMFGLGLKLKPNKLDNTGLGFGDWIRRKAKGGKGSEKRNSRRVKHISRSVKRLQ